ncbi:MAG: glucose-1-phosphate thymidylyltransferase RfbA [Muribaculaceae bacterium]|nr:glucose-1-phosphate thymidylyltransferase RfbA [Muribaculaceae bacterium]
MKGIVLAGGSGSRLWPITRGISKQLVPVYDKPMIYYPLSVLILAGIRDIMVITTPEDSPMFRRLLADGRQWGINLTYRVQERPEGLAQALTIAADWLGDSPVCLVLGDNIFYGQGFTGMLLEACAAAEQGSATIFAYPVQDPRRYGVVALNADGAPVSIVEKPAEPASDLAVVGLYFYPAGSATVAAGIRPSARGELEITTVNEHYLNAGQLRVARFGRGFAWLDTGTVDSLMEASAFIEAIQKRQGLLVAALEEVAYRRGFITATQLADLAMPMLGTEYGKYLKRLADGK